MCSVFVLVFVLFGMVVKRTIGAQANEGLCPDYTPATVVVSPREMCVRHFLFQQEPLSHSILVSRDFLQFSLKYFLSHFWETGIANIVKLRFARKIMVK